MSEDDIHSGGDESSKEEESIDETTSEETSDSDSSTLSQDEIEAVIAGASTGSNGGGEDESDSDLGLLTQEEIEAIIAENLSHSKPRIQFKPVESTEETSASEPFTLSEAEIDALVAEASNESVASVEDESEGDLGLLSQDDIEALLAENSSEPESRVEKKPATPAEESSVSVSEALSQDNIDALVPETSSKVEAPVEEPSAIESETLSQDDIEALLADPSLGQEDTTIDKELESMSSGDSESLLAEGAAQDVLDNKNMEERLDGSGEDPSMDTASEILITNPEDLVTNPEDLVANAEEEVLGVPGKEVEAVPNSDIDALLAGASSEEDGEVGISQTDIDKLFEDLEKSDEELAEAKSEEAEPEPEPIEVEAVSEEVLSEVAGENIAAGAAPDEVIETAELMDEPVPVETATVTEPEPAPVVAKTSAKSVPEAVPAEESISESVPEKEESRESIRTAAAKVPGAIVHIAREEPWRAITATAAGLLVAMSTYIYISMNEFQSIDNYASIDVTQDADLYRSIGAAQYLLENEEYVEASTVIEHALLKANPKNPLYIDAEYVKLEADLKALPDRVSVASANRAHTEIDRIVTKMPLHNKRSDALFWKGQLYEAEENPQAARVEYRNLLDHDPNATNRHEVLLAMGQLEMKTDRPVIAAKYLQQLRLNFPRTNEALQARLLIADAYAAIGDYSSARTTYISIAEAHPESRIGADAFARLGKLAYESGDYEQAIRELEERLNTARTTEGNDSVTLLLAKAYRASGRVVEAKNLLNGLIDFFPVSDITPLARIEMSQVLDELGLGREAVRYATQTVQTFPAHQGVLRNAGEMLAKNGDSLDAARALLAAQTAGADDPELLLQAGRLFAEAGSTQDAKEAFEQLLLNYSKTRQGIMGNIELAKLSLSEGRPSEAIDRLEELRSVVRTSSQQLPILLALGELYSELGVVSKVADTYGTIAVMTNEPEVLAQSAIALLHAGVIDEGLIIAQTIEVQQLSEATAYAFLNAKGYSLLQVSAKEGLGNLEQAHAAYPTERTANGVQGLLEANLTLDRSARARALVTELKSYVSQREHYDERPRLEQAAATWGNYLFKRQDYRAAANAYEMAFTAQLTSADADASLTPTQSWSLYQQANALYRLSDYATCIPLYERLSMSNSQWAPEATTKLASAQLEQRMRGISVPEARNAG